MGRETGCLKMEATVALVRRGHTKPRFLMTTSLSFTASIRRQWKGEKIKIKIKQCSFYHFWKQKQRRGVLGYTMEPGQEHVGKAKHQAETDKKGEKNLNCYYM